MLLVWVTVRAIESGRSSSRSLEPTDRALSFPEEFHLAS